MKPYRTDDFITKLFYETSRFSALNHNWVIKAKICHDTNANDPTHSSSRSLMYQLVLKSKLQQPFSVHFVALKGPYGDMKVNPVIYRHDFTAESSESSYVDLPIIDSVECNKLLASKTINMRLIIFQVPS